MRVPDWLDEEAKKYWKKHYKALNLEDKHAEGFAVLCQTYADYRHAIDMREKTKYLDFFLRQCKEYGLTPKSKPIKVDLPPKADELDDFIRIGAE